MGESYRAAGVDLDAGATAVAAIRGAVRSTYRPEVLGDIGSFGGLFQLPEGYREPVLVAATDGVGTKLELARRLDRWDTVGIDLVAMCVDDLVCQGAEPLFFLDYLSVGALDPVRVERIVAGVADGCRQAGCALIGGEMAEHPGVMAADEVELAGFATGIVERDRIITGERVEIGDELIGLLSPGLRSNGYSLVRRLLERSGRDLSEPAFAGAERSLGDELLLPSVIYAPAVRMLLDQVAVRAVAHITGGGLPGNVGRALPRGCGAVIDTATWEPPPIFAALAQMGDIDPDEMARTFNLGIGMTVVVPADQVGDALDALERSGVRAAAIGHIEPGHGQVRLER